MKPVCHVTCCVFVLSAAVPRAGEAERHRGGEAVPAQEAAGRPAMTLRVCACICVRACVSCHSCSLNSGSGVESGSAVCSPSERSRPTTSTH